MPTPLIPPAKGTPAKGKGWAGFVAWAKTHQAEAAGGGLIGLVGLYALYKRHQANSSASSSSSTAAQQAAAQQAAADQAAATAGGIPYAQGYSDPYGTASGGYAGGGGGYGGGSADFSSLEQQLTSQDAAITSIANTLSNWGPGSGAASGSSGAASGSSGSDAAPTLPSLPGSLLIPASGVIPPGYAAAGTPGWMYPTGAGAGSVQAAAASVPPPQAQPSMDTTAAGQPSIPSSFNYNGYDFNPAGGSFILGNTAYLGVGKRAEATGLNRKGAKLVHNPSDPQGAGLFLPVPVNKL